MAFLSLTLLSANNCIYYFKEKIDAIRGQVNQHTDPKPTKVPASVSFFPHCLLFQWKSCPSFCQMLIPPVPFEGNAFSPTWHLLSTIVSSVSSTDSFPPVFKTSLVLFYLKKKKKKAFLGHMFLSSYYSDVHLPTWINSLKVLSAVAVSICSFSSTSQFTMLFLPSTESALAQVLMTNRHSSLYFI